MQIDAIRREPKHVDFYALDLKKKIAFMVPVSPQGKSKGEKEGGTLQLVRHELELFCLPTNIPPSIEIDVEELEVGDVIHIDEVTLPKGVESKHDVNFTVLTVVGRMAEEVEEVEEEELLEGEVAEGEGEGEGAEEGSEEAAES
jgi:large subunit ribosomal protein L25